MDEDNSSVCRRRDERGVIREDISEQGNLLAQDGRHIEGQRKYTGEKNITMATYSTEHFHKYATFSVLLFGLCLIYYNLHEVGRLSGCLGYEGHSRPVVWMYSRSGDYSHLGHVEDIFKRVGYVIVRTDAPRHWHILWSFEYPFNVNSELKSQIEHMVPGQKVNKFPGSGFITNKVELSTLSVSVTPKTFRLPLRHDEFINYSSEHPEKLWVQKSNAHRGIKVIDPSDLALKKDNSFVQEFVPKPFLIDNRKFDIGIYAVLTSIEPLRVYVMESDILLRFCPKDYYPFDAEDVDKYVVAEDYTPLWEMPSLKNIYTNYGYTFKETFKFYMKRNGQSFDAVWLQIMSIMRTVYLSTEKDFHRANKEYLYYRHFFELVRFDFLLDEDLKVYLMEVNMSPNLSSDHFAPNAVLYEQVLLNTMGLMGFLLPNNFKPHRWGQNFDNPLVNVRDIRVFMEECSSQCKDNCSDVICSLCKVCHSEEDVVTYKTAYIEQTNRRGMTRMWPPAMTQEEAISWSPENEPFYTNMTSANQRQYHWFRGMCLRDTKWCS